MNFSILSNLCARRQEIVEPSNFPGVYVRIGGFLGWISHVMESNDENHNKTADVK